MNRDMNRFVNILKRATDNGFAVDPELSIVEASLLAENYLIDKFPVDKYEWCDANRTYSYSDGKGYELRHVTIEWEEGLDKYEFRDAENNLLESPEKGCKVVPVHDYQDGYDEAYYFIDIVIDSDANIIQLYTK